MRANGVAAAAVIPAPAKGGGSVATTSNRGALQHAARVAYKAIAYGRPDRFAQLEAVSILAITCPVKTSANVGKAGITRTLMMMAMLTLMTFSVSFEAGGKPMKTGQMKILMAIAKLALTIYSGSLSTGDHLHHAGRAVLTLRV